MIASGEGNVGRLALDDSLAHDIEAMVAEVKGTMADFSSIMANLETTTGEVGRGQVVPLAGDDARTKFLLICSILNVTSRVRIGSQHVRFAANKNYDARPVLSQLDAYNKCKFL